MKRARTVSPRILAATPPPATNSDQRTDWNRIAEGLCGAVQDRDDCRGCARNRANRPRGTWSATPDVMPIVRNGLCNYVLHPAGRAEASHGRA